MDLEDSVWLKTLLNKAFNHVQNIWEKTLIHLTYYAGWLEPQ
jgi:hypothetical protein